jgi:ribonuclease P protein component
VTAPVLPPSRRLRSSADFAEVVRRGRRAAQPLLTVHAVLAGPPDVPARAGLVVSKAVGGSVIRTRTARRLRHLLRDRLPALPPGSRLVVRAAPTAASATSAALGSDLDAALRTLTTPRSRR